MAQQQQQQQNARLQFLASLHGSCKHTLKSERWHNLKKKKKRTLISEALISSTDFIHRRGSVVITETALSKSVRPIYDHKDSFMRADRLLRSEVARMLAKTPESSAGSENDVKQQPILLNGFQKV